MVNNMKLSIAVAVGVVVVMAVVTVETPVKADYIPVRKLSVHCSDECIKLYADRFLSDTSDRTTDLIIDCINQCTELLESSLREER